MKKQKSRASTIPVWISYDLGKNASYDQLYGWLKGHQAAECGNSTAMILYKKGHGKRLSSELRKELEQAININADTRIYIIYRGPKGCLKAMWLIGVQKPVNPWDNFKPIYYVP